MNMGHYHHWSPMEWRPYPRYGLIALSLFVDVQRYAYLRVKSKVPMI